MQPTTDVQMRSLEQAQPATRERDGAVTRTAVSRLAYVDTLRMVLIILVIMVHAAVTYGAVGDWTYRDTAQVDLVSEVLLSLFVIVCQSFFMALFFFFAGYFVPGSIERKGLVQFWKDRLLRLGIPLVAYTWFISRIPNYIDEVANHGMTLSFWQFSYQTFWIDADEGPTWFLFALLIFSAVYTLWRLGAHLLSLENQDKHKLLPVPGTRGLLGIALGLAAVMFVVSQVLPIGQPYDVFGIFSLLLVFFPAYILLFTAGILAYRNDWLARLPGQTLRFWAWFSAGLVVFLPAFLILGGAVDLGLDTFLTGLNWRCVTMCLWFGLACISFSMTLTLWLRDRVKPRDRLAAFVGPNNFAVYLIHPLVLVPITLGLSFFSIHPLIKFVLASVSTVGVCFLLADMLRRLPGAKAIL